MPYRYINGILHFDGVSIEEIVKEFDTPLYLYSERFIRERMRSYLDGAKGRPHLICYAVKANSNGAILRMAGEEGLGADIVSGGELFRALRAGIDPKKIVYSGVGKHAREIGMALEAGIGLFSVESESELELISELASQADKVADISIRINPNVDPKTHPYISTGLKENKFGIEHERLFHVYDRIRELPGVNAAGIGFHIGSQLTSLDGYVEACHLIRRSVLELRERGHEINRVDVGGGLGIVYDDENPPTPDELVDTVYHSLDLPDTTVIFEPGRSIVGNAGIFLTRVLYNKRNGEKKFHIVDGAMNDLIRPSLYNAHHRILSVREGIEIEKFDTDLVGPVCETGDFLAKNRHLPSFQAGDLVALASAGAYGAVMSSNYNSRPRSAEALVTIDGETKLIRRRETFEDLIRHEVD